MSKPSFVYCFSKKLAKNEEQYAINLQLLEKSTNLLKKLYSYKLVTDTETFRDVENFSSEIEIIDTQNFNFLDDIKLSLLQTLSSSDIIIDPDIFVFDDLNISNDVDIIFEHKEKYFDNPWYEFVIESLKGTFLYDKIKSAKSLPFVPNIGFLKINNKKLLKEYIEQYEYYSKDIVDKKGNKLHKYSIILGQYLLGMLLFEGNYSYLYMRGVNNGNKYSHLAGPIKYKKFKVNKQVI